MNLDFENIYISKDSLDSQVVKNFQAHFPAEKFALVDSDPLAEQEGPLTAKQFARSKKLLYIKPFKGSFFKRCPGFSQKKALSCCNYFVLNLGQQCNYNCSYCYLQSYLNSPTMQIFSNLDQAIEELDVMAKDNSQLPFRVGTGEVIDSLSLDPITLYSRELIEFFKKYPRWTLEFKTKSANVDQFLNCSHAGNIVVSWSVNASQIVQAEEHGTASLAERLAAARKCADQGFKVAFHIDPMIWHQDWKASYQDLVEQISTLFRPEEVNLVSLGSLRFQPEQRHMMRERFGGKSLITKAELFPSEGGKLRYDTRIRREMFQWMMDLFKNQSQKWNILMCMETPETWISTYKEHPMKIESLQSHFRPLPKIRGKDPGLPLR